MGKLERTRRQRVSGRKSTGDGVALIAIGACLFGLSTVVFRAVRLVGVSAAVLTNGLRERRPARVSGRESEEG